MKEHLHNLKEHLRNPSENISPGELVTITDRAFGLSADALDALESLILVVDGGGAVVAVNESWRAFRRREGRSTEGCVGRGVVEVAFGANTDAADVEEIRAGLEGVLAGALPRFHLEYPYDAPEGRYWFALTVTPLQDGRGAVLSLSETTERKRFEAHLLHQANHDPLTGLPNRRRFGLEADRVLALAKRDRQGFAVLYLDLSGFKGINDAHGHEAGDEVLREVGARLLSVTRKSDLLARMGGDEFAVLLQHALEEEALKAAARYEESFARPLLVRGREVQLGASFGIGLYRDGDTISSLLDRADRAMFRAKARGGGVQVDETALAGRSATEASLQHSEAGAEGSRK